MESAVAVAATIPGMMSLEELQWLYETARNMMSIVEIGSYRGRSTYALASGCSGMVYAVDPFDTNFQGHKDPVFDAFMAHMSSFPNIEVAQMTSREAASYEKIPVLVDMVFIDADHNYDPFLLDLHLWTGRARKMVCGHDCGDGHPGIERALIKYFGPFGYKHGPGSLWFVEKGKIDETI